MKLILQTQSLVQLEVISAFKLDGKCHLANIRSFYLLCLYLFRNIVHGSDSLESAEKEIDLWFSANDLCSYDLCAKNWVYED